MQEAHRENGNSSAVTERGGEERDAQNDENFIPNGVIEISVLPKLAETFQQEHGNAGQKGGTIKFSSADLQNLKAAGLSTIDSLSFLPVRKLLDIKGISEQKAELLKKLAEQVNPGCFQSASEYMEQRKAMIKLTTGSSALDAILGGGIETGNITELFGEFRCGKTQLCHTLAITSQLPTELGGADGKVLWIDTEGTFRPERLVDIAERFGLDPKDVLDNVCLARAYNTEHQMKLVIDAAALMSQARFGLLIVDSAMHLYRTEYTGRGELADRQQHVGKFMRSLQRVSDEFGVAVVITNQVCAKVDGGPSFLGPQVMPIGGHIIAHASQTRLQLRKGRGDSRIVKIFDSPSLPESEATFSVTTGGIMDEKIKGGGGLAPLDG